MKRIALVAALLSAGCDDPAVQAVVDAVELHGATRASMSCASSTESTSEAYCGSVPLKFSLQYMWDGSSFGSFTFHPVFGTLAYQGAFGFTPKGGPIGFLLDRISFSAEDGLVDVHFQDTCPGSPAIDYHQFVSIDEDCTGFNLEAFGIEE